MIELTPISQFIANLGFPIFVGIYMLVFTNRTLNRLTSTLEDLKTQNKILITLIQQKRTDEI